jgi:hypothetical protein
MRGVIRPKATAICLALLATSATLAAAGCGSSSSSSSSSSTGGASTGAASIGASGTAPASGGAPVNALAQEAGSAGKGDIPDNQVYLSYTDRQAGYSIKYPEGWTRTGSGSDITFAAKNNRVHIVIAPGPAPSTGAMSAELNRLKTQTPTLRFQTPAQVTLTSGPAVKAAYTTQSAPNSVTGKSVQLIVDRYELAHGGKRATVDLGTAQGVDNIDAYKMMINSFKWL